MLNIIELNLVSVFRIQFNFHFASCLREDIYFTIMLKFTFSFQTTMKTEMGHIKKGFIALKMPHQTLLVDL